jgi:phosphomannomutase
MDLLGTVRSWLEQDPDPETRSELEDLIAANDHAALEARFSSRLEFGTAGLRGELGAGPNRMNQVVVAQTALGIAKFLKANSERYQDDQGNLSVVIGYDARINSDVFAKLSAEIFAAESIRAKLFSKMVPTPVAAFTGRALGASATVVVTASHNPPRDNGYKVYLGGDNGHSQLTAPQDSEIAKQIDAIAKGTKFNDIPRSSNYEILQDAEIAAYQARAIELVGAQSEHKSRRGALKITYTAMHGVGHRYLAEIFKEAGFSIQSVLQQQEPDGTFPTVAFPNPEEPGAMDLAFALAEDSGADLILANDPDADRLAVGFGQPPRMLTGDQVGLILAEMMASRSARVIANSIVSQDLSALAEQHGIGYQQTLTGFKWISKVPNLDYGYEEALGYCVDPSYTPDKDGITAALMIAELASQLKEKGQHLGDELDRLAMLYGKSATGQVSIRVQDLGVITKVMEALRSNPPATILEESVTAEDYQSKPGQQQTNALIFHGEKLKVIFRPSGTEPKLKCYLQYRGDQPDAGLEDLKSWANQLIAQLAQ